MNSISIYFVSLDEIATYDVSSCIDFILKKTQQHTLTVIGYSMGSTLGYILLSEKPEYNEKVDLFINMAPITYFLPPTDKLLKVVLSSILVSRKYFFYTIFNVQNK